MKKKRYTNGRKLYAVFFVLCAAISSINLVFPGNMQLKGAYAQEFSLETIRRKNIVIDLGEGLTTEAQLTLPAVGDGPFPGVLLIHGSGNIDMDGYLHPSVSGTEEGSRILLQIAEYLSERGFAVLRYNKRSIGLSGVILDMGVYMNMTVQDLIGDAEKAIEVLKQQNEVNANEITIIGHSEGTIIAPRIAIKDSSIKNIVLMGVSAYNVYDVVYWQTVDRFIQFSESVLDTNLDGLISVQEIIESIGRDELSYETNGLITNITGKYDWLPGFDTDQDGYCSIQNELKPYLVNLFNMIAPSDPTSPNYWPWLQSHRALNDTNLDIIGNVSSSILLLHGEGEIQCTVEHAFLLEQRLLEVNHPDHTLITYPGLGHSFYPANGLVQLLGPIRDYVLSDLVSWLKDPGRNYRYLIAQFEEVETKLIDKTGELDNLSSEASELESHFKNLQSSSIRLNNTAIELKRQNSDLQSALNLSRNIAYFGIGLALIGVMVVASMIRKR